MLYQEYRDTDDALEPQIQSLLKFAKLNTSSKDEAMDSSRVDAASADVLPFTEVDQQLSDDEQQVLSLFRDYQQSREMHEPADLLSAENADAKIVDTLALCQPALQARNNAREQSFKSANGQVDTDTKSDSLLSRLSQRLMPASRPWSMPVGAVAAVALAVVALSLFKTSETGNTMIELTGVPSYQQAVDQPLHESLPAAGVAAMGFSPADAETAKAYAIGSLVGELAIAVAGNDKERSLQTISRIELLDRASPEAGTENGTTGALAVELTQARARINESEASALLKDDMLVDALGSLMSKVRGTGESEQLASYQKLGSWTLLAMTLLNASEDSTNAAWRRDMLARVMEDAQKIHPQLLAQPDLTDAQRRALEEFQSFAKDSDTDVIKADGLRAMNDITRKIDTSFRI